MRLFVYGTLRSPALMAAVAGEGEQTGLSATLNDYAVLPVAGDVVPLIRARPGAVTPGLLWQDLREDQVERLDLYEGAFGYALIPVTVQLGNGNIIPSPSLQLLYLGSSDLRPMLFSYLASRRI